MLRIIFLFALCTGALAERLTLTDLSDPKSNLLFSQLAQYRGTSQTHAEAIATATAANSILKQLAPSILLLSGYTGLFTGNCSMLFNHQLEEVACDINSANAHDLMAGADIIPGTGLPVYYANQIRRSNILLANIFADWTGRKKQEFETDLYFKTTTCSQTLTQEPLPTPSVLDTQTQTASASATASLSATMTWLASVSASSSRTLSPSLPVPVTPTASASHVHTPSVSPSPFATHTASLSSTYSKTLSLLSSATRSLTASLSPTRTITPPPTKTQTKSLTPIVSGLLSVWNASTGVYADATNQPGRYTIFNGTVNDTLTNLLWEQTASNITMDWPSAASYCAGRTTSGLTGWRVPNIAELGTIVDYTVGSPYVNTTAFPNTPANGFWVSTSVAGLAGNSWEILFSNYGTHTYGTTVTTNKVRCVCLYGPILPSYRYLVDIDIATDTVTGLIWQRTGPTSAGLQANAASYCSTLSLAGFGSGWRLPTIKELATLVDYSASSGTSMMDATVFSRTPGDGFWSSTSLASDPSYAWLVGFDNGNILTIPTVGNLWSVRCVR